MSIISSRAIVDATPDGQQLKRRNRRLLIVLASISIGMTFFGFALKRAYTLICVSGGGGIAPNNLVVAAAAQTHTGRVIEVFFEKKVFDKLPVRFFPDHEYEKVEVGVEHQNVYHFENLSNRTLHFRPIHQLSPPIAARDFAMRVCFCFNDQVIGPGETKDFPVSFTFGTTLHDSVTYAQVCYSLFEITGDGDADHRAIEAEVDGSQGAIMTPGFRNDTQP